MSDEKNLLPLDKKLKSPLPPKPPKKLKRGTVFYEPERSVRKVNIFRDRVITLSGNVNILFALALLVSAGMNAWIITQPNVPSPFFIQYTSGQIAPIKLYSKDRLPPPVPLDIQPLASHARLDDGLIYSDGALPTGDTSQSTALTPFTEPSETTPR